MKGVSASITVGKLAEIGTGFMELIDKNKYSGGGLTAASAPLDDDEEVEETIDIEEFIDEEEEEEEFVDEFVDV